MKKTTAKIATGVTGAVMLLSGCAAQVAPAQEPAAQPAEPVVAEAAAQEIHAEYEVKGYNVQADTIEKVEYKKQANVQGSFIFNQDVVSPTDDVFSIFGTAVTAVCASPAFATENSDGFETYYFNVSGNIKKQYSIKLSDVAEEESESAVLKCSCATSSALANAQVLGVPLSAVIRMDELEDGVNTITVRGADGYGLDMPLQYALEKKALIVYKINGEDVPSGTQLWMPSTVARYFTRNIASIELTARDEVPEVEGVADEYRAKVNLLNYSDGCKFPVGKEITFEGYADDCGSPIEAVEFSLDGGETWSSYETANTTTDKWVMWNFSYVPEEAGTYQLTVRARTADGTVSPLASSMIFTVE